VKLQLQSLCGSGFSVFAVHMLAKPYHLGVNWPTTLCENKDGVHFFTFNFERHNRYNKLLLCNSENSDIAWCDKNNSEWGFSVFFKKKKQNLVSFLKKTKKKQWVFFLTQVFLNPGTNKQKSYSFETKMLFLFLKLCLYTSRKK